MSSTTAIPITDPKLDLVEMARQLVELNANIANAEEDAKLANHRKREWVKQRNDLNKGINEILKRIGSVKRAA